VLPWQELVGRRQEVPGVTHLAFDLSHTKLLCTAAF
jgi:hypothetical protein